MTLYELKEEMSNEFYKLCSEHNIYITSRAKRFTYTDNPYLLMMNFIKSKINKAYEEGKKEGREEITLFANATAKRNSNRLK